MSDHGIPEPGTIEAAGLPEQGGNRLIERQNARRREADRRPSAGDRPIAGLAVDFDPARLVLARRLAGLPRTTLAGFLQASPATVAQYENGQNRPSRPIIGRLAAVLGVQPEFFQAGYPVRALVAAEAHFRSPRSSSGRRRDQALAFAELTLEVFVAVERQVDLPLLMLPDLDVPAEPTLVDAAALARQARQHLGLTTGPVPNMVRLLEAHGVAVVWLDGELPRVEAFSHHGHRPIVLLNPAPQDKARSRFDAAHELGHLLIHSRLDAGGGATDSRLIERQAQEFAAEFLAPAAELHRQMPFRLDWTALEHLKRHWGISLKTLIGRGYQFGRLSEACYYKGLHQLATWGQPERGDLGLLEAPVLLSRALSIIGDNNALPGLAQDAGLPLAIVQRIARAAGVDSTAGQGPAAVLKLVSNGGKSNDGKSGGGF